MQTVAITKIVSVLLDELAQLFVFCYEITLELGEILVCPFHRIVVVKTDGRRIEVGHGVAHLCHVVVARIVHDRGCGAILICERLRTERIDRIGEGSAHVVHKSEGVTDFVSQHILK